MSKQDIRWVQRLSSYCKALDILKSNVELASERDLSLLEKQGVIQSFEFTQELAWKTIKDLFELAGETTILGSRDAFHLAFQRGLLSDGTLMKTIESRNKVAHIYKQEIAEDIFHKIVEEYYDGFEQLRTALLKEKKERGL